MGDKEWFTLFKSGCWRENFKFVLFSLLFLFLCPKQKSKSLSLLFWKVGWEWFSIFPCHSFALKKQAIHMKNQRVNSQPCNCVIQDLFKQLTCLVFKAKHSWYRKHYFFSSCKTRIHCGHCQLSDLYRVCWDNPFKWTVYWNKYWNSIINRDINIIKFTNDVYIINNNNNCLNNNWKCSKLNNIRDSERHIHYKPAGVNSKCWVNSDSFNLNINTDSN